MTVRYYVRRGHPVPTYVCQREGIETAQPPCQIIRGMGLDEAVAQVILEAVTPASLEVAFQVFEDYLFLPLSMLTNLEHSQST